MPYTVRTLTGSLSNLLYPSVRKITFDDSPAVVLVSTHLRFAWTALPAEEDTNANAVGPFIKANHERSEEERNAVPQNPDSDDIQTPWREAIYYQWNHVFYDIGNFLAEVGPGIGYLNPPAHEILAVHYPESVVGAIEVEGVKVVWKENVLVLPAHLESGISLRMVEMGAEAEDGGIETKTIGTFDGSNSAEIWYIKEGTEVRIFVEGEYDKDRRGVAAVLVYGKLTTTYPEYPEEEEEAEEEEKEAENED